MNLEASKDNKDCQKCQLYMSCQTPFMPAYIPVGYTGKLLVIGEAPGKDEDQRSQRPFTGKAGQLLLQLLGEYGIIESDIAITNSNRCRPKNNATPTSRQIKLCHQFLIQDILKIRPKWIFVLGDTATKAVVGSCKQGVSAAKYRNRIYEAVDFVGAEAQGIHIKFSYHPASTFYGDRQTKKLRLDALRDDINMIVTWRGYMPHPEQISVEAFLGEQ